MNLKIGIVGLPNVGKSTLFNALTKSAKAEAQNFPFCTIDPNVGIVEVPDKRLGKLAEIVNPEKIVPSAVEFVDIAGLVEGASKGEGLGNKFLANIRECQAIAHVVRVFDSSDIHHVSGSVDAKRDLEIIMVELILSDLESVTKQLQRVGKKAKAGDKEAKEAQGLLEQCAEILESGVSLEQFARDLDEEQSVIFKTFHLLTPKPYLVVANTSEEEFANFDTEKLAQDLNVPASSIVPVCAQFEAEMTDMDDEEREMFLSEIGAEQSGLENLIQAGFFLLGLQSYFTAGVTEVRAWTIKKNATAPEAAGAIHTDFERGFIKADVIAYQDFIDHNGEAGAKEAGKMKMEGKSYIVQDGDVMHFKFNV